MTLRNPTFWDAARELHLLHWPVTAAGAATGTTGVALLLLGPDRFGHLLAVAGFTALPVLLLVWAIHRQRHQKDTAVSGPALAAVGALAVAVCGLVIARTDSTQIGWWLALAGTTAASGSVGWWAWDRLLCPLDSAQQLVRAKYHANRAEGTASAWDLFQFVSASALRRTATVLRPSLKRLTPRQLKALHPTQFAVEIIRTGWKVLRFTGTMTVHAAVEAVILTIGGPRMGKSGAIAARINTAPGFALVTSTRLDLLEATKAKRSAMGRIIIFNPTGLGSEPSTMRWSPLSGCKDFPVAQRRADSMIPIRTGEGAYWSGQARQCLAVLLHAAALKGYRMQKVADWVADLGDTAEGEIVAALRAAENSRALIAELKQVTGQNDRTKTSTTASMRPALGWLANSSCVEVGDAPVDSEGFIDLRHLVERGRDTIYLIGSPDVKTVTPLLSALTAEIAYQLRMVAGDQPSGRLDPPARLALDEMALTCPEIPIGEWSADFGGRNITLDMSLQSLAQLREKWGPETAASILNNVGCLLVFGGTMDDRDLETLSKLVGSRLELLDPDDSRYVAVLDPARIAGIAKFEALVIYPGIRPVLGRPQMVWEQSAAEQAGARPGRARRIWAWVQSQRPGNRAPQDASELIDLADHLPKDITP